MPQHEDRGAAAASSERAAARTPDRPASVADWSRCGCRPPILTAQTIVSLQRLAGNAAVAGVAAARRLGEPAGPVVQREFEDQGQTGAGELGSADPAAQPDLAEAGGGSGELVPERINEFGELDGELTTDTVAHVFVDRGQVATDRWHHCGGTGGRANESTGSSTVVAPVYESSPPTAKAPAKAWVKKGTGNVKVTRSWNGVVAANNGTALWAGSGGGLVFITWSAVTRMGTHERGHIKHTKSFHDSEIKPMEGRIRSTQSGATEPDAVAALQSHVNWNATLAGFAAKDTAMNGPGATFDTTDAAKSDFYHDKGPRKIKKVSYQHFIEAP